MAYNIPLPWYQRIIVNHKKVKGLGHHSIPQNLGQNLGQNLSHNPVDVWFVRETNARLGRSRAGAANLCCPHAAIAGWIINAG
jgi:hypothetical protein